jgi:hypothetical protein
MAKPCRQYDQDLSSSPYRKAICSHWSKEQTALSEKEMPMFEPIITAFGALVLLALMFLPTVIAVMRGHPDSFAIFLTNLLLGWTGIGWIVALIWAFTARRLPNEPRGIASA